MSRTVTCRPVRRVQSMIRWASSAPLRRYDCSARPAGKSIASQHRSNSVSVRSFEGELLDVEVHQHVVLGGRFQDRPQRFLQCASEPSKSIGSVRAQSELILIETLVRGIGPRWSFSSSGFGGPLGHGARQRLDQVEVAPLILGGFLVADAGLAQQIDAEGHALGPLLLQGRAGRTRRPRRR